MRCPSNTAREEVCEMLLGASESNAPHALRLSVKVPWTEIELAKDVSVEYTVATGPAHIDRPIGVRWKPLPGGIYPSFEGELSVLPGEHSDTSILQLEGHYTPPLGIVGAGFDAAVGHKVAEATVHHLLEGLASGIVAGYRAEKWQEMLSHLKDEAKTENRVRVVNVTAVVERLALPPPV